MHFSSATDEWSTPPDLFNRLNEVYQFDLDAAASSENAKCQKYFTKSDDGLSKDWRGAVWLNPPYGREIGKWIKKAYEESLAGALVVCLVPARTDTKWWHEYAVRGQIEFIRGRLKFGDSKSNAPFPSAIIKFEANK